MNKRLYASAALLPTEVLNKDQKAYFKSILGTLNHIMVGDIIWLKRFATHPSSNESLSYITQLAIPKCLDASVFNELNELRKERKIIDRLIIEWIAGLSEEHVNECISYTNMAGVVFNKPFTSLINHLFLHQAHHRGQATTLLSQSGVDFGETDLIEIINECDA